jgi:hypothetical protein
VATQIEKQFLERIKGMQTQYSREGLTKPKDKSEFGFGETCGTYQGLILAEQLFLEVVGEEDDRT